MTFSVACNFSRSHERKILEATSQMEKNYGSSIFLLVFLLVWMSSPKFFNLMIFSVSLMQTQVRSLCYLLREKNLNIKSWNPLLKSLLFNFNKFHAKHFCSNIFTTSFKADKFTNFLFVSLKIYGPEATEKFEEISVEYEEEMKIFSATVNLSHSSELKKFKGTL